MCVGELGPGSCIGELLLRGREIQPYSTVSAAQVRVGWVDGTAIRGKYWRTLKWLLTVSSHTPCFHTVNEVDKHILSDKSLAIPIPTQVSLAQEDNQTHLIHLS